MTPNERLIEAAQHLAAALEGLAEPAAPTFPETPVQLKPWCGKCTGHEHREVFDRERDRITGRCPDCHPFPNPEPSKRQCMFCGVAIRWGTTVHGRGGWVDDLRSPGCAYSTVEFEHQPIR